MWSMSEGTSDTDGIVGTLEDLPESPDLGNVDKSLSYLHTSERNLIFLIEIEKVKCDIA